MTSLRRYLATSDEPLVRRARKVFNFAQGFTLPAPKIVVKPMLWVYLAGRSIIFIVRRLFIAEPLFKAYCKEYGKGVTTDIYVHWIQGRGDIILGDYVNFDGHSTINFAARFVDRPTLAVGDHSSISGGCVLTIGKRITIGRHVRIASDVFITDSSGHASEPVARKAGAPPSDADIRPVTIGDNVWIGKRVTILPGVTIGEGSIVSTSAVVTSDVAPYTIVGGNPARKAGNVPRSESAVETGAAVAPASIDAIKDVRETLRVFIPATGVRETIRGFITDTFMFRANGRAVADSESLLDAGVLDSVGVLIVVQFIEKTFEIEVDDEEVEPLNFASIDKLAGFVTRKLGKGAT